MSVVIYFCCFRKQHRRQRLIKTSLIVARVPSPRWHAFQWHRLRRTKKNAHTHSTRTRFFLHILQIIAQFSGSGGACEHSINSDEDKFKVVASIRANARQSNAIFFETTLTPANKYRFAISILARSLISRIFMLIYSIRFFFCVRFHRILFS